MAGDIFLLGNTPWRIRRVERGRVRVEDAQGLPPSIPFWLGEAPGRTRELSDEKTGLRESLDHALESPSDAQEWVMAEAGVSLEAAQQLVAYLEEGKRVLGTVPTGRRLVAERFFDESGGMQLVIHAPFGSRINRAWGMALRKRICRSFDIELQASATDDGINFSMGPQISFPLTDVFSSLSARNVEEVLVQAVLQSPLFGIRWRWNATRALALPRFAGGKKVPPPLQRMRSDDLLAAVFPAQVACQDNADPGDIEIPDHPLVFETMRDCLTEAMDLDGLREVLAGIERGDIEVHALDTVQPSVFAHQILNAMPYSFLDDAPLEERRARAVPLRRALPEDSADLGALDPKAIEEESDNAWPRIRDPDELHDALLVLGILPEPDALTLNRRPLPVDAAEWFSELERAGRALRLCRKDGTYAWVASECVPVALAAYPEAKLEPKPDERLSNSITMLPDDAILTLVRGWVECSGPFTPGQMAHTLDLPDSEVNIALARLEAEGLVLRGRFRAGTTEDEFCDRRILARIHRATINCLRKEVEPVSQSTFVRFLFHWQHADPSSRLRGEGGLFDIVEQLQGFEAAAGAWESDLLAARISEYVPYFMNRLCLGGEVVWGRLNGHQDNGNSPPSRTPLTRATPITFALRESLAWLLNQHVGEDGDLPGSFREVMDVLSRRGASFLTEIAASTRRLSSDAEEALWLLAAAGRVTSDSLEALRQRIKGKAGRGRREAGRRRGRLYQRGGYSRWSLLEAENPAADSIEMKARQLLRRYGVLCPELLARETSAPRWRELVRVLRTLEARGEIRGGRFVAGYVGEQFALPEAVQSLRRIKNTEPKGQWTAISACDPLNVVGVLTPGERVPAVLGNRVAFKDGVPVCSLENGNVVARGNLDEDTLAQARSILGPPSPTTKNDAA